MKILGSQNDVNYVNQELIDFVKDEKDIGWTQDLQENVESGTKFWCTN